MQEQNFCMMGVLYLLFLEGMYSNLLEPGAF
jgi:hypothetical protein